MVAFCSGVWVLAAALCPRGGGEPPAVSSAAALVLLVAAVFSVPMGAYLALELSFSLGARAGLAPALDPEQKLDQNRAGASESMEGFQRGLAPLV